MTTRNRKIIAAFFAFVFLIAGAWLFREPLSRVAERLSIYTAYRDGGNFYRTAERSDFRTDERWLHALLFDHMREGMRGDARHLPGDPFDKVLGESRRAWKVFPFAGPVSMGNRQGYAVGTDYRSFMQDPWDDLVLRSLYCDVYGYSDEDFRVLGTLSPDGGYTDTHVLLALLFLRENGCYDRPEREFAIRTVSDMLVRAAEQDGDWSDLFSERIVFLYWAGEGARVKPEWIDRIVSAQEQDGGWADEAWGEGSNPHSTGLSMLALRYFLEEKGSAEFLSPLDRAE